MGRYSEISYLNGGPNWVGLLERVIGEENSLDRLGKLGRFIETVREGWNEYLG